MKADDIVAQRTLWVESSTGKRPVVVAVGRPYPIDGGENYECPFTIDGMMATSLRSAKGVDSVQALSLALSIIGASLYTSREYKAGELTWFAGQDDLGFPRP
jgi:hypothetical protein